MINDPDCCYTKKGKPSSPKYHDSISERSHSSKNLRYANDSNSNSNVKRKGSKYDIYQDEEHELLSYTQENGCNNNLQSISSPNTPFIVQDASAAKSSQLKKPQQEQNEKKSFKLELKEADKQPSSITEFQVSENKPTSPRHEVGSSTRRLRKNRNDEKEKKESKAAFRDPC